MLKYAFILYQAGPIQIKTKLIPRPCKEESSHLKMRRNMPKVTKMETINHEYFDDFKDTVETRGQKQMLMTRIRTGNTSTNGDLEGTRPRLTDEAQDSGIQAIVSTGNSNKTMNHKRNNVEVSLPLCKGARSNNSLMKHSSKIPQRQALAGKTKVSTKVSFTKKDSEN
jgi:hypothetical protein